MDLLPATYNFWSKSTMFVAYIAALSGITIVTFSVYKVVWLLVMSLFICSLLEYSTMSSQMLLNVCNFNWRFMFLTAFNIFFGFLLFFFFFVLILPLVQVGLSLINIVTIIIKCPHLYIITNNFAKSTRYHNFWNTHGLTSNIDTFLCKRCNWELDTHNTSWSQYSPININKSTCYCLNRHRTRLLFK